MKWLFDRAQDPVSFVTHALGAGAALLGGAVFLLRALVRESSMPELDGAMCFALSLLLLYGASAAYHYCPGTAESGGVKRFLRKLDHSMIYVLIAGSYTPFALALLPQPAGWRFCLAVWGAALLGIVLKLAWMDAPRWLSTLLYLAMGWAILFVRKDFAAVGQPCLTLIALGGVCYTAGAGVYAVKRPNLSPEWSFHELFHLLILAGSAFHYLAVFFYVL